MDEYCICASPTACLPCDGPITIAPPMPISMRHGRWCWPTDASMRRRLTEDGKRLGAAILETETVAVGTGAAPPSDRESAGYVGRRIGARSGRRKLATTPPYVVNPGYFSPRCNGNSTRHQPTGGGRASLAPQRVLGWQLIGNRDAAARLGHRDLSRPCHSHRTRQRRSPHTLRSRRRAPTSAVRRILRSRGPSPRGCDAPRPHCAG